MVNQLLIVLISALEIFLAVTILTSGINSSLLKDIT